MDEMTQIRELRVGAPTPDRARLAPGRQRVADAAEKGSRRRALRADWRLTALGAAAAVVVAVLVGVQLTGGGWGGGPRPSQVVVQAPPLNDAKALLHRIADAAAQRPDPEPKVGQWVYTKTYDGTFDERDAPSPELAEELGIDVGPEQESWYLYADPEFENWKEGDDHSHRERYEFLADLPADPEKAFAKLRKFYPSGDGNEESENAHNARAARVMAGLYPAPPDGIARLYRAMATLEGISVVDHLVEDATGRKAVALYVEPDEGAWSRNELLFDPQTLEYVGHRSVAIADDPFDAGGEMPESERIRKGDVFISQVVLRTALVEREGQQP